MRDVSSGLSSTKVGIQTSERGNFRGNLQQQV